MYDVCMFETLIWTMDTNKSGYGGHLTAVICICQHQLCSLAFSWCPESKSLCYWMINAWGVTLISKNDKLLTRIWTIGLSTCSSLISLWNIDNKSEKFLRGKVKVILKSLSNKGYTQTFCSYRITSKTTININEYFKRYVIPSLELHWIWDFWSIAITNPAAQDFT